jgi:hypothetical protein
MENEVSCRDLASRFYTFQKKQLTEYPIPPLAAISTHRCRITNLKVIVIVVVKPGILRFHNFSGFNTHTLHDGECVWRLFDPQLRPGELLFMEPLSMELSDRSGALAAMSHLNDSEPESVFLILPNSGAVNIAISAKQVFQIMTANTSGQIDHENLHKDPFIHMLVSLATPTGPYLTKSCSRPNSWVS